MNSRGKERVRVPAAALFDDAFLARTPGLVGAWTHRVAESGYDRPRTLVLAEAVAERPYLSTSTPEPRVPVAVVRGVEEAVVDVATGKDLAEWIRRARCVSIRSVGHRPSVEIPRALTDAVPGLCHTALASEAP